MPKVNSQGKVKVFKCKQCEFVAVTKEDFWRHSKVNIKILILFANNQFFKTTKLLSAKVKNSQVILRIILPILQNSFKKAKVIERFCKKWQNNPQNNLNIFQSAVLVWFPNHFVQVNLCQKLLFLHQLIHNMTTDCSLSYKFNT